MIEKFYESIIKKNNDIIKSTDEIIPIAFFIKGEEVQTRPLEITKKNKDTIKKIIKTVAVKGGYNYVIIVNTFAKRKKEGVFIEGDCCIRAMYTPKNKIIDMVWHKNGEVLATERIEGRNTFLEDEWDAWSEGETKIIASNKNKEKFF